MALAFKGYYLLLAIGGVIFFVEPDFYFSRLWGFRSVLTILCIIEFKGNWMKDNLVLDEKTLKRIPPAFVFALILILGMPGIAIHYFGIDFSAIMHVAKDEEPGTYLLQSEIRAYFRQTLLQWSAFSLAAITVLLAFTQYRLTYDKIALIIGLSVLFSGAVEALHTLIISHRATALFLNKYNIDAVLWTVTNTISGIIIMVGLIITLRKDYAYRFSTSVLLSIFLFLLAVLVIYYSILFIKPPEMLFEDSIISRPYEAIYLTIYLVIILFIYPKVYKLHPYILTNCIFYMAVTEIVIAIYLMLLSHTPYDTAYNIAYFLKIIVYFIPFCCLIINYVFSYNTVLETQEQLRESERRLKYIAAHDVLTNI